MARFAIIGAELNTTSSGVEWTARVASGWPSISGTIKRSGGYSVQISSLVSATPKWVASQYAAGGGTGPFWYRVYLRPETLPSAENTIIVLNDAPSVATPAIWVTLDNTGVLRLYDEDGAIGSASPALTLQSFAHRIELEMSTVGGAGACIVRARLNGSEFAGSSTRSLSTGANSIIVGGNLQSEAQTQGEWYFDDLAINSSIGSIQNSYPGAGSVVAIRPNATGDSAQFARGGTDSGANWSQTDEIVPNDVGDYVSSGTLDHVDDYNCAASPADVGTVNVVGVFARHTLSSATGTDPRFVTRIKASAGGTVEESAQHVLNSTAWFSNADGTLPSNLKLILYDLPGASTTAWTQADLDAMQIGVRIAVDDADQVWVSTLLALVDYVPSAAPAQQPLSELPQVDETFDEAQGHNFVGWQSAPLAGDLVEIQPLPEITPIEDSYDASQGHDFAGWQQQPLSGDVQDFQPLAELPAVDFSFDASLDHDFAGLQSAPLPGDVVEPQPLPETTPVDESYDETTGHDFTGWSAWQTPGDVQDFQPLPEIPQVDQSYNPDFGHDFTGWQAWNIPFEVAEPLTQPEFPSIDQGYDADHGSEFSGWQTWQTPFEVVTEAYAQPELPQIDELYDPDYGRFYGYDFKQHPTDALLPSGDVGQSGNWKRENGSAVDLYLSLDEPNQPSDADYVWHENVAGGEYFETALTDPPGTPGPDLVEGLIWRGRRRSGTQTVTVRAELREDGTVIAQQSQALSDVDTTYVLMLSAAEKAAVNDWRNLRLRFTVESVS